MKDLDSLDDEAIESPLSLLKDHSVVEPLGSCGRKIFLWWLRVEDRADNKFPSGILSKYGVHGFPTLFLLNSTVRVRYRGSRGLSSLVTFYSDVTGIKSDTGDNLALDKVEILSTSDNNSKNEPENCPCSWARSPENLLRQETYLALDTAFVLFTSLYFLLPYMLEFSRQTWTRYIHARIGTLWERPLCYLKKAKQLFNSMKDSRKRTNFQEGARAWASKSLASAVSIGDATSSRNGANH